MTKAELQAEIEKLRAENGGLRERAKLLEAVVRRLLEGPAQLQPITIPQPAPVPYIPPPAGPSPIVPYIPPGVPYDPPGIWPWPGPGGPIWGQVVTGRPVEILETFVHMGGKLPVTCAGSLPGGVSFVGDAQLNEFRSSPS